MKKIIHLLLGDPLRLEELLLILSVGLTLGIFTLFTLQTITVSNVLLALLAMDIGSGLISNSRTQTNRVWQSQPKWMIWTFIVFHLTVYPTVLVLLSSNILILCLLIALLVIKVGFFFVGVILKKGELI